MDVQFRAILLETEVRHGTLNRVANTQWGLELGVLKMTHDAVITSLLRYALAITGSVAPPDLFAKRNSQVVNTATRKTGGPSRSARIGT